MSNLEIVTVVNRTSKMLKGTWNGRPYDIKPGESHFPRLEAIAFRYQNPIMGRGTPMEDWNSKSEYLIGIKELGDDISPIEQSDAVQRWDMELVNGRNVEIVRGRAPYSAEVRSTLPPAEPGFVKP